RMRPHITTYTAPAVPMERGASSLRQRRGARHHCYGYTGCFSHGLLLGLADWTGRQLSWNARSRSSLPRIASVTCTAPPAAAPWPDKVWQDTERHWQRGMPALPESACRRSRRSNAAAGVDESGPRHGRDLSHRVLAYAGHTQADHRTAPGASRGLATRWQRYQPHGHHGGTRTPWP